MTYIAHQIPIISPTQQFVWSQLHDWRGQWPCCSESRFCLVPSPGACSVLNGSLHVGHSSVRTCTVNPEGISWQPIWCGRNTVTRNMPQKSQKVPKKIAIITSRNHWICDTAKQLCLCLRCVAKTIWIMSRIDKPWFYCSTSSRGSPQIVT